MRYTPTVKKDWYEKLKREFGFLEVQIMNNKYTEFNSKTIDKWVEEGWEWGQPISHEVFERAKNGDWFVVLTPIKPVPKEWFCEMKDAEILGLASGGGQQMPIFTALGAKCTVLDYSDRQLLSEQEVAERENYEIKTVRADMTNPLPFAGESFDLIFHPVSNCYIEDVLPVWQECYRVLKKGGILLAGLDNGINYVFNDDGTMSAYKLPFNPLKDEKVYEESIKNDWGIQFSHPIEEQIGGQLRAGFVLTDIYHDTNSSGKLNELNVPTFYATRAVKR
jgi:SAM-dependent methyltransferase